MRQSNQFQLKKKTTSVLQTEGLLSSVGQFSSRSPISVRTNTQSHKSFVLTNEEIKLQIQKLLEENKKLIAVNNEQDQIIINLQNDLPQTLRSCRVNTLSNPGGQRIQKQFIKQGLILDRKQSFKEDMMQFTFFSPEPENKSKLKLPKVFQIIPKKKKYFI